MADRCPHCGEYVSTVQDAYCPECRAPLDELPMQTHSSPLPQGRTGSQETKAVLLKIAGSFLIAVGIISGFVTRSIECAIPLIGGIIAFGASYNVTNRGGR